MNDSRYNFRLILNEVTAVRYSKWILILLFMFAALGLAGCQPGADDEADSGSAERADADAPAKLVVYTSRQPHLVEPLFKAYEEQTGVAIEYISDDAGALIERLAAEGENSDADLLLTVDAGNLWQAAERGLLRSLDSETLQKRVPDAYQDPEGRWFGLSIRARTIVYHPERVDVSELSTYAALADPKWQGRLCLRTSRKVYNQSLVAMMIDRLGEPRTEEIVSGWVANLATGPFSSDTRLIEAIAAGQCDLGIVNTYYLGRLQVEDPDYPVRLFWANQDSSGVHVNISGAGVTANAPRPQAAVDLLEWMVGDKAQQMIAASNLEFPVVPGVALDPVVKAWGDFEPDSTNLGVAGQRQAQAVKLMDRAGWR
ncbi:MAG: Fe(3+) ABC transporter substrate-binding protein [Wenzhouxiangellaceae bacterium]|nr:Fe(3+) ABC transporter substrate-binding protein [Wenzhouxiangellaceae bacterium]